MFDSLIQTIAKIILTPILLVSSLAGYHIPQHNETLGGFYPTGGGTYRLAASVGTSDTSVRLSSFKEPVSNIPYTMSYLNSDIAYGTLDPQSNKSEFISFTGITQNNDGTALLTGVTRGLGRTYPYTASSTLRQSHAGQSIFILSDSPQVFNEYVTKRNAETISGVKTFASTSAPLYDYNPDFTSLASTTLASIGYVASTSYAGTVDATQTVKGIVEIATGAEAAASTITGSTGARLALATDLSTSSYNGALAPNRIPVTGATGQINHNFIATSTSAFYNWGATHLFTASTTNMATTTIAANSVTGSPLRLNNNAYAFPATQTASSTVLATNGSGSLSWVNTNDLITRRFVNSSTTPTASATNGFATSSANLIIPANTLNASSTIQVRGGLDCDNSANGDRNCVLYVRDTTGTTLATLTLTTDSANAQNYLFDILITSNGLSINNQIITGGAINYGADRSTGTSGGAIVNTAGTYSLTSGATLVLVIQSTGTLTTATLSNYSIVVNI